MRFCKEYNQLCPVWHPTLVSVNSNKCDIYKQYQCGGENYRTAETKSIRLGLCELRHEMKDVQGYIFPQWIDTFDPEKIRCTANMVIKRKYGLKRGDHLNLYTTGLTVALVEVINVCRQRGISLTIWHYNKKSKNYYKQAVI